MQSWKLASKNTLFFSMLHNSGHAIQKIAIPASTTEWVNCSLSLSKMMIKSQVLRKQYFIANGTNGSSISIAELHVPHLCLGYILLRMPTLLN